MHREGFDDYRAGVLGAIEHRARLEDERAAQRRERRAAARLELQARRRPLCPPRRAAAAT